MKVTDIFFSLETKEHLEFELNLVEKVDSEKNMDKSNGRFNELYFFNIIINIRYWKPELPQILNTFLRLDFLNQSMIVKCLHANNMIKRFRKFYSDGSFILRNTL